MPSFGPFRLDVVNQCLWHGDERLPLMPKPFAVLRYLVDHPGRLVTQDELMAAVWTDTHVQPDVLRRYILEIRRVLGDSVEAPRFIQTFPKRGYEFIAPVVQDPAPPPTDGDTAPLAIGGAEKRATRAPSPALPASTVPARARVGATRRILLLLVVAAVIAAVIAPHLGRKSEALRDRDSIVLADVENRSGEAVFDFTLRQAL